MFLKWFLGCYFVFMSLIWGQSWKSDVAWMFRLEDWLFLSGQAAVTWLVHVWLSGTRPCHTSREDRREGSAQLSVHYFCSEAARSAKKNGSQFTFYCCLSSTKKARLLQGPRMEELFHTKLESEGLILRGCRGRRGVLCNSKSLVWDESDHSVDVSSDVFTLPSYLNFFEMTASVGCNRLF